MKVKILFFKLIPLAVVLLLSFQMTAYAVESYKVDLVHSSILFRIKHLGITYVYGLFRSFSGKVNLDKEEPGRNFVEIWIDAGSVDTENTKRDNHLKSPDFFDIERYPTISFKSKNVKKLSDSLYDVTGNMTLHGITRTITVQVQQTGEGKDPWGGYRIGAEATFTIKRSNFGMTTMLGPVGDKVRITISIEAVRK